MLLAATKHFLMYCPLLPGADANCNQGQPRHPTIVNILLFGRGLRGALVIPKTPHLHPTPRPGGAGRSTLMRMMLMATMVMTIRIVIDDPCYVRMMLIMVNGI